MKLSQNSLFKADTYVRSVVESRILGLVHENPPQSPLATGGFTFPGQIFLHGSVSLGWYYSLTSHQLQMVKIPLDDRATHLYAIGASGAGKTKFLEFLLQQDITLGNGFCIIDPHGDLIDETLGFLACHYHKAQDESIFDRVILVDPTNPVYTVGFNVLEVPQGVAPIEQAQELIMVFKRIWAASWGVRMEELLRNSLIALSQTNLTLGHLPAFLTSQPFRSQVMEQVSYPARMTKLPNQRAGDNIGKNL